MKRIKLLVLAAAAIVPAAGVMFASAAGPNLIANGNFAAGVAGWDNFGGNPQAQNGAMKITNSYTGTGNSYYSGWYCAPVQAGTQYDSAIDYFVPESAPANSGADLQLHYYASTDCSGSNLLTGGASQSGGRTAEQRGKWLTFSFKEVAPATAKSVRIRATAVKEPKPYSSSIVETHYVMFDNAFFGKSDLVILNPVQTVGPTLTPTNTPTSTPTTIPTTVPTVIPTAVPTQAPQPTATPNTVEPASPGASSSQENDDDQEPGDQPSNDDAPAGSDPKSTAGSSPAPTTAPLPPATGDGEADSDSNTLLMVASAVSMLTGLGLIAIVLRKRRAA